MKDKFQLSIIIINYNTRNLLIECLDSMKPSSFPESWCVTVVDNDSTDGSLEAVRKKYKSVNTIDMGENAGFPGAVNRGIKAAEADYYFILNSDTKLDREKISGLLEYMESQPEVGATTPMQENINGEPQLCWGGKFSFFSELKRKRLQDAVDRHDKTALDSLRHDAPFETHWVSGASMFLRGKALKATGLMDENIFLFFEDIDLCLRIRKAGWKVTVNPVITIIHHRGESAKTEPYNASLHYRESQLYLWKKYHSPISVFLLKLYLALKFAFRLSFIQAGLLKLDSNEKEKQVEFLKKVLRIYK